MQVESSLTSASYSFSSKLSISRETYSQILEKYENKIFNFAKYVSGIEEVAEDTTINVFLELLETEEEIDSENGLEEFLFRLAYQHLHLALEDYFLTVDVIDRITILTGTKIRNTAICNSDLPSSFQTAPTIPAYLKTATSRSSKSLINNLTREIFAEALQNLPIEFREAFLLNEMTNLSLSQIADLLNIEEAKVSEYLVRVLPALRQQIINGCESRHDRALSGK